MLRRLLLALSLVAPAVAATAVSAQSTTTRIESRPYYGAVVTLEQGVRVWRPLPPTGHMIINPTNAPVNLNIADVRETHTSHNYNYDRTTPSQAYVPVGSGSTYGVPVFRNRGHYRPGYPRHHRRHSPGLGR